VTIVAGVTTGAWTSADRVVAGTQAKSESVKNTSKGKSKRLKITIMDVL
jgi:hypothetical protein